MKVNTFDLLRKRYPESEYALMSEVRDAAGFSASRSADYIVMNLWPSRGLSLSGIEQKSFRSDWTKELKSPEKADAIFKFCDYWWLLTTAEGVAHLHEIPEQWGWMHIDPKGKIKIMKEAPKLTPGPIDRNFLACLLKRSSSKTGYIREDSIRGRLELAKQSGLNDGHFKFEQLSEQYKLLQDQFNEFRSFTGIDIGIPERWRKPDMEKIGKALNIVLTQSYEDIIKRMENVQTSLNTINSGINRSIESLKEDL